MFSAINVLIGLAMVSSTCCFVEASADAATYSKLCEGQKVDLKTTSQVIEFAGLGQFCSVWIESPLKALAKLLQENNSDPSCGPQKILRMHAFYREYLKPETNVYSSQVLEAFIAYGMRLSQACREDMINVVMSQTDHLLKKEDYDSLNKWTREGGPISKLFNSEKSNGLALPSAMVKLLEAQNKAENSRVYLRVSSQSALAKQKNVCERRFLPIYSKITFPLLDLASIGFNYNGEAGLNKDQETVSKVSEWYRIVFICEMLLKVGIIEHPNMAADEMEFLEEIDGMLEAKKQQIEKQQPEIELVKYDRYVSAATADGLLVDHKDSRLKKAIKNFHVPSLQLGSRAKLSKLVNKAAKSIGMQSNSDDGLGKFLQGYAHQIKSQNGTPKRQRNSNVLEKYFFRPLLIGAGFLPGSIFYLISLIEYDPTRPSLL